MLSYRHRGHGEDWQDVREVVPLVEKQCLTGYDVTRTPRVVVSCYELH